MNEGKRMWRPKQKPLEDRDQSCQKLPSTERVQSSQRFSPVSFPSGTLRPARRKCLILRLASGSKNLQRRFEHNTDQSSQVSERRRRLLGCEPNGHDHSPGGLGAHTRGENELERASILKFPVRILNKGRLTSL